MNPDNCTFCHSFRINEVIGKFDLTFEFNEFEEDLVLRLEYNADLFSEEKIQYFSECYVSLIENVTSDPSGLIGKINLTSADESDRLDHW